MIEATRGKVTISGDPQEIIVDLAAAMLAIEEQVPDALGISKAEFEDRLGKIVVAMRLSNAGMFAPEAVMAAGMVHQDCDCENCTKVKQQIALGEIR